MSQRSVGIIYKHHFEPAKEQALKLDRWLQRKRDQGLLGGDEREGGYECLF